MLRLNETRIYNIAQPTNGGMKMTLEITTSDQPPPEKQPAKGTYSIAELAKLLGVSQRHIHRLKDAKELPGLLKLGGRIVFSRVQIDRWLSGKS